MTEIKKEVDEDSIQFGQCRCCLSQGYCKDIMTEHTENGEPAVYYNIFVQCFNLFLKTDIDLTTLICVPCVKKLQDAYDFRKMTVQSEMELLKVRTMDDTNGEQCLESETNDAHIMDPEMQQVIKTELDDDSMEADNNSLTSCGGLNSSTSDANFILPDLGTDPLTARTDSTDRENAVDHNQRKNVEASLESLRKIRLYQIKNKITDNTNEAETYCNPDVCDPLKAQICASKLERMIELFKIELNQYFKMETNAAADEMSDMRNTKLKGEEILAKLKSKLTDKSETDKNEIQNNEEQNRILLAKVPDLPLPQFSGDVSSWFEFWDMYKVTIHNRPIPDADKLFYLKSALIGEAKSVLDGLETTDENYTKAIQILTDKYEKKSELVDANYTALREIKPATTSITHCRNVLNTMEHHLRILQSLGENTSNNYISYLLRSKFPADILDEMKMMMKEETVEEMRKQLKLIISAQEIVSKICGRKKIPEKGQEITRSALSKIAGKETCGKRIKFCVFCEKTDHFPEQCIVYPSLEKRQKFLKKRRRCYKCFSYDHMAAFCTARVTYCCFCNTKKQHNRALCPKRFKKNEMNPVYVPEKQAKSNEVPSSTCSSYDY